MAKHNYAVKIGNDEHTAKAVGRSLPVSVKHSVELCRFVRKKELGKAKEMLQKVIDLKMPVPFKSFTEIGHKKGKGVASGRYPKKAAKELLKILESAEANAQFKGMNTSNLVIAHVCCQKAAKQMHYGRNRGQMKRSHIEVVLKEGAKKEKKSAKETAKKEVKKEEEKKEVKESPKKEVKKEEKAPEAEKKGGKEVK